MKKAKGYIDRSETFDEFLAKDGLLVNAEKAALKKIVADQKRRADIARAKRSDPTASES
jgi:hypothetical protein